MKNLFYLILLFTTFNYCFSQSEIQGQNPDKLYEKFVTAYDELDAELIAGLYLEDAIIVNLYDEINPTSSQGLVAIKKSFHEFFENSKKNHHQLQLTFKISNREKLGDLILDNGFYKLEFILDNEPNVSTFGKFSTVLQEVDGSWKFKFDANTNTDFQEYENAGDLLIPERDETLYPNFYDNLLGNYVSDKGEFFVVGRSQYRLFVYHENNNEFYGLTKVDAKTWTAGVNTISKKVDRIFKFKEDKIEIYKNEKLVTRANKEIFYKTEKVSFLNSEKISLGGTLFLPKNPNGKGVVLVHGSGPQDRNGYASIIRLLADVLSRNGTTVLIYDKQGVGSSSGNWQVESFHDLGQDAISGVNFLKSRKELNLTKIGLAGSSQAGWIIAKAIANSQEIDFVLTIGAAGSGVSVVNQNLYNTEVVLRCRESFTEKQITNILQQQKHFFDFLKDKTHAHELDRFTKKIRSDGQIRDWLFPTSKEVNLTNRNQWFTALEVHYEPLETWKNYDKPVFMIFSEHDDSTPSAKIMDELGKLKKNNIEIVFLKNTQHIGLEATSKCKSNLGNLKKFKDDFFPSMTNWIEKIE